MTSAEIDQFLEMVKQTFSDVLFPIEYITQQDFLGQGNVLNEVAIVIARYDETWWTMLCAGAFGVVHKGDFVDSDGSMMPIAIKTIKCKCWHNNTVIMCTFACIYITC